MTQDEIILLADASGISLYGMGLDREKFIYYIEAFAKLVAQHEHEACAKVCEEQMQGKSIWIEGARACSLAIRARGQA